MLLSEWRYLLPCGTALTGLGPGLGDFTMIEAAKVVHRFEHIGIEGGEALRLDSAEAFEHVRDVRDIFVDRVLAGTTDDMGEAFIEGQARFVEPAVLDVDGRIIRASAVVIASGSPPLVPEAWQPFAERILTSDDIFEQRSHSSRGRPRGAHCRDQRGCRSGTRVPVPDTLEHRFL